MYNLIKNNQKKLLAIFGVLLMVVFIIPPAAQNMATQRNPIAGRIGQRNIYDSEMRNARAEWSWLEQRGMRGQFGQNLPLPGWMFSDLISSSNPAARGDFRLMFQAEQTGVQLASEIEKHPELFLLLQKEAGDNGFVVSEDDARSYLVNKLHAPPDAFPIGSVGAEAIKGMLLVGTELTHLNSSIKVSSPAWRYQAADRLQKIRLNLVDFRTSEFEGQVPPPTPAQLREQFDKYKDTAPGDYSKDDVLGFGYQVPTRVKLQYIEIPHTQVVQAVIHHISPQLGDEVATTNGSDTAYDWQVKAAQYYEDHKDKYRNIPPTEPATGPATTQSATTQNATTQAASTQTASTQTSSTQVASTQVASTQAGSTQEASTQPDTTQPATHPTSLPAIKPFAEVKAEIIDELVAPDVTRQADLIAKEVISELTSDSVAIRHADPAATRPSTQPTTSAVFGPQPASTQPVDEHMTFAHLEQIRDRIEKKYHVAIQLHDIVNGWEDAKQLALLPGIGTASTSDGAKFPDYATSFARPRNSLAAVPLAVWEPSQRLTDSAGKNIFVFRLTAAEAAHALPDMSTIAMQVEQDWKLAQAYDRARVAAQKLLDSSKELNLSRAAQLGGQSVISTGMFSPMGGEIPEYPLTDPVASGQFSKALGELTQSVSATDRHPERLIELPSARRVVVAELAATELEVPEWYAQLVVTQSQRQIELERLAARWFDYDAVVARLDYKAVKAS